MADFIKINVADNVAVAIHNIEAGGSFEVDGVQINTLSAIPAGHKVALRDMAEGEDVIKYGFPIGHLLKAVPQGGLIAVSYTHLTLPTNVNV